MKKLMMSVAAAALMMSIGSITMTAQLSQEPSATDKVRIVGWALNMSNIATGANQTIQIDIDGWSNPSQRQHLIDTFLEKKQDGLVRELEKQPELGKFRFPGYMGPDPNNVMRLGTDIRYAMSFPMENGGRRIVIITPRVIGFQEARNQPRTVDYPFSLFEMRFDKAGKGEGRLAYATQISLRQEEELDRDRELLQRAGAAERAEAGTEEVRPFCLLERPPNRQAEPDVVLAGPLGRGIAVVAVVDGEADREVLHDFAIELAVELEAGPAPLGEARVQIEARRDVGLRRVVGEVRLADGQQGFQFLGRVAVDGHFTARREPAAEGKDGPIRVHQEVTHAGADRGAGLVAELLVAHEAALEEPQRSLPEIAHAAKVERMTRGVVAIVLGGEVAAGRCRPLGVGAAMDGVGAEVQLRDAARLRVAETQVEGAVELPPEPLLDGHDVDDVERIGRHGPVS